jgi:hypothetical protein
MLMTWTQSEVEMRSKTEIGKLKAAQPERQLAGYCRQRRGKLDFNRRWARMESGLIGSAVLNRSELVSNWLTNGKQRSGKEEAKVTEGT